MAGEDEGNGIDPTRERFKRKGGYVQEGSRRVIGRLMGNKKPEELRETPPTPEELEDMFTNGLLRDNPDAARNLDRTGEKVPTENDRVIAENKALLEAARAVKLTSVPPETAVARQARERLEREQRLANESPMKKAFRTATGVVFNLFSVESESDKKNS